MASSKSFSSSTLYTPIRKLTNNDVWSTEIAIHKGFVEGLVCSECRNIPKKGLGFTCDNGHIYCKLCINLLIKQNSICNVDNKIIKKYQPLPKVLQHMISELNV